jgi:hypothetical protein
MNMDDQNAFNFITKQQLALLAYKREEEVIRNVHILIHKFGMSRVDATLLTYGMNIIHLKIFSENTIKMATDLMSLSDSNPLDPIELKIHKINIELLEFMLKVSMEDDIRRTETKIDLEIAAK